MSVVTNLLLAFDILEDEDARVNEANEYFADGQALGSIWTCDCHGGHKAMEVPLWGGAFNHFDTCSFVDHLRKRVTWVYPQHVRVFVAEQDDATFNQRTL